MKIYTYYFYGSYTTITAKSATEATTMLRREKGSSYQAWTLVKVEPLSWDNLPKAI
jgi:hypothetical protein